MSSTRTKRKTGDLLTEMRFAANAMQRDKSFGCCHSLEDEMTSEESGVPNAMRRGEGKEAGAQIKSLR